MTDSKKPPEKKPKRKMGKSYTPEILADLETIADKYVSKHPNAYPYNAQIADEICEAIATHPWGLERICKKFPHFPDKSTIWLWKLRNQSFSDKYYKAKLAQAELHVEECFDISDDVSNDRKINHEGNEVTNNEAVNRSRLKVDTRKWVASKLLPKQYGDKQQLEDLQAENANLRKEMMEYRKMLDEKNKKDY
jgi:terminase small subunit-like protein